MSETAPQATAAAQAAMATAQPALSSGPTASRDAEVVHRDIARLDRLYDVSVRDYFSTFATYSTAATILVAALSFPGAALSPLHTATIAVIGLYLCVQWHVSTAVMRDQYRYFIHCLKGLEAHLDGESRIFANWQDAQTRAQNRRPPDASLDDARSAEPEVAADVSIRGSWAHRRIRGLFGMRAAAFPALYGAIFALIACAQAAAAWDNTSATDALMVAAVLLMGFLALKLIHRERTHKPR